MEQCKYSDIFSTSQPYLAIRSCGVLEDHRIPVITERIDLQQDGRLVQGFRVLVPSEVEQRARELLGSVISIASSNSESEEVEVIPPTVISVLTAKAFSGFKYSIDQLS